jgi:3-methyladenine DNA glycosylase AlkD
LPPAGPPGEEPLQRWALSPDRGWRRAALATTVALNTRSEWGRGDASRTLAIAEMLVNDRDDMVVKALSWALRALAEQDRAAVKAFVETNEDRMASRVRQEVCEKLVKVLKNPNRPKRGSRPH